MRGFYFLLLLCCFQMSSAQSYRVLLNTPPKSIDEINITKLAKNQLYISTPFAKEIILNPEQKQILAEKAIIKIELVYTKYRASPSFNQKRLNQKRLNELNKLVPSLFENPFWSFELISQTNGNSRDECNKMFHGFILTFRPNSSKAMLAQEANYLQNLVATLVKADSIANDTTVKKKLIGDIKTHYDKKWGFLHDTIWIKDTIKPPAPPDFFYNQSLYNDSTVLHAFDRNKNWSNFIVVTDMTGSMSPYNAQVFVWLKGQANNPSAKSFVFFNDGDEKESKKKKPLETKGIYIAKNTSLDEVTKMAIKCMHKGSGGGENLENDIEAIIDGLKNYPQAEGVILIADNFESMRDYKYIEKIKVPVHVILCGAENRINIQYLDLARQTKGSVHTISSDITDLQDKKEGEEFFIDDKKYLYQKGKFHFVYDLLDKYR